MRRGRRLIAVLLFAVLVAWPITAFASGVDINVDPQANEQEPIRLAMPSDADAALFALYLHNTGNAALENLALLAFLQDAQGQPVSPATVVFKTAAGAPLDAFDLAAGEVRPISLEIGGLTAHGVFTGTIFLRSSAAPPAEAGAAPAAEEGAAAPIEQEVLAQFGLIHPGKVEIVGVGADGKISLDISAMAFSFPLTLRETTGQAEIAELSVEVGELVRTDGASGSPGGLSVAPADPFTLPAGGYRTITLSGDLPDATAYSGWLALEFGGEIQPYTVAITRTVSGRLAVLEAGQAGDVVLNVRGPAFQSAVTLRVPAGQPAITDLTVDVTGLSRQDGQVLQGEKLACSPCGKGKLTLEPGVAQTITLNGDGFMPAAYRAFLRLGYEGQSQDVPLTITREALASNIVVDKPETVAVVNWWPLEPTASVPIHIREAQGQQMEIYYPDSGSLTLTTPDNRKVSAVADRVEILQRNSTGNLEPLPTPAPQRPPVEMPVLVVDGDLNLIYRLTGIGQAGAYAGKVTVAGPDSQSVTQDVEIQVKHGWVSAFLAILLGVLLSYFWHSWSKEGRSRALLARDIALTRESIEAIQARNADAAWGVLLASLKTLDVENRDQRLALADGQARLVDIQSRKGHFGRARLAHDQALRVLAGYPTDPPPVKQVTGELRKAAGDQLQALRELLENAGPLESVAAAVTELEKLAKTVREKAIKLPAHNLVVELQALIEQNADRPQVVEEAGELKAKAAEIESNAADASQQAALADQLRGLKEVYARLRIDLLGQAAAQLEAGRAAAPEGQSQRVDDLLAELHRSLDDARGNLRSGAIDPALAAWRRANNAYLGASIYQLAVLASPLGHPAGMERDEWDKEVLKEPRLRAGIAGAEQAWEQARKSENDDKALELYKKALESDRLAREAFLRVQVTVLKARMAAFVRQAGQQPSFLAAPDLDKLWQERVGKIDVAAAVAGIDAALAPGGAPGDQQAAYRSARVQFAGLQHEWLSAAHAVLVALSGQTAPADPKTGSKEWPELIPDKLKLVAAALQASQDLLDRLKSPGDHDETELLEAEQRIHSARGTYAELVKIFRETFADRTETPKVVSESTFVAAEPGAGSGPSAATPAPGAAVAGGALTVAGVDAVTAAPWWFGAEPQSSREWDDVIRGRDLLVFWIALFIATISGLSALYLTNPTFGSLTNYIAAILWGFGIQAGTQLAAAGAGGGAGSAPRAGGASGG